ncbi:uncharacterized protein N7479_007805 [Penicillium vulpinum]|uniref:uncharacterized protein n=1 Tax=Penicillium vulpinum TaxID=29845 RepID=UPI002547997D|nr:uncharacterized protein N7479_007805 [Penicillium vulpinum]KAJ5960655.1 hypothetical protein N7479_007805 [Penicillium vulpinum]
MTSVVSIIDFELAVVKFVGAIAEHLDRALKRISRSLPEDNADQLLHVTLCEDGCPQTSRVNDIHLEMHGTLQLALERGFEAEITIWNKYLLREEPLKHEDIDGYYTEFFIPDGRRFVPKESPRSDKALKGRTHKLGAPEE